MHSSLLFLCTFFAYFILALFSSCTFSRVASSCFRFMSHLFLCCTHFVFDFIAVALFHMELFPSCNFFVLHLVHLYPFCVFHSSQVASFLVLLYVALTSCCTFFVLHFFRNALFSIFTFFVLYTFNVALFRVALFSIFTIFEYHFCTFFRVTLFWCCTFCTLFSCCTFFVLYRFHVAPSCVLPHVALCSCCTY